MLSGLTSQFSGLIKGATGKTEGGEGAASEETPPAAEEGKKSRSGSQSEAKDGSVKEGYVLTHIS